MERRHGSIKMDDDIAHHRFEALGLIGRTIEETKNEIIPEMRRQLVSTWRENNRAHESTE